MQTKNYFRLLVFLVIIMSLVLAACAAPAAEPTEAPPEAAPTEAPVEVAPTEAPVEPEPPAAAKVATFIWTQEFDTLNPQYTQMWFSSITQQLWNCWAWDFDDQSNALPRLVTELPSKENGGISEDNKTITLKLRDDIVWSDGTPLTANDFVFTYEMVMNPANIVGSTNPFDLMESVTAPDERTVVTTFTEPYAPWLANLWHGVFPKHVLGPVFDAEGTIDNAEWNRAPTVGCGPYVFAEWESGSFARFVANENYWAGRPKIDEVFFRFVPDDASQVAALLNKEGDLGTFVAYSDIPALEEAGLKVLSVNSGYAEGLYFNLTEAGHPALKETAVRQAIAYGSDRAALSTDLLLGLTKPASTYWDGTPYNDPSLTPYPFDPEMAKSLLDEAGWVDSNGDSVRDKDGVELILNYGTTTREIRKDTQAVLQQQLGEIGIKIELFNYDSDQFFADYANNGPTFTGELDMWEYSNAPAFPDPDNQEWLCAEVPTPDYPTGINGQGCFEELDALFQLQITQVDAVERTATFNQISKMIFDNVYWLGLWQDPDIWVITDRIENAKISGTTPFFNIIEWDLVE